MSSPAPATRLTATPGTTRVAALDALRGIAVAGIVPMNVIAFAMPAAAYVNPRAFGGMEGIDLASWALVFIVVEDKFRAIFAMLFGAGVAILLGRDETRPLGGHYARMAALFAIGLAHATLIASNDILRVYAVCGLILPLVIGLRPRVLFCVAGVLMAAQLVVSVWYYREYLGEWVRVQREGGVSRLLDAMEYSFGGHPDYLASAIEQGREGFVERLQRRWSREPAYTFRVLAGVPSSLAAMLVGIGVWRNGLLAGEWPRDRLMRLGGTMAVLALVPLGLMCRADFASDFDAVVVASVALVWSAPFDLLLAVGWVALLMSLFASGGALTRLWAAVGRMALSNYLLTSLVFGLLFSAWGLGLFARVGRVEAYLLGALPVALMLAISPLWLARVRQGPAEWLWRALARGWPVRRA